MFLYSTMTKVSNQTLYLAVKNVPATSKLQVLETFVGRYFSLPDGASFSHSFKVSITKFCGSFLNKLNERLKRYSRNLPRLEKYESNWLHGDLTLPHLADCALNLISLQTQNENHVTLEEEQSLKINDKKVYSRTWELMV